MGPLSDVEPRRLREAFSMLCVRTPAAHATLDVEMLPLRVRCGECGIELARPGSGPGCPECGHSRSILMNGDDLELKLVEFEEPPRQLSSTATIRRGAGSARHAGLATAIRAGLLTTS
jgi:hydrogenase nickel incorporation protein HypA/HybF